MAFPSSEIHVKTDTGKTVINIEKTPPAFMYQPSPPPVPGSDGEKKAIRVEV